MAGTLFHVETSAPNIVGFDPARDKLDVGLVSVHNFIIVDTPDGVGFMNPWSGQTQLLLGVSLGQLTIDSFMPIDNNHLRQDVSGALAWAHGIEAQPGVVVARSHEIGQLDRVAFDAATDWVDMRYYGTREQIYLIDSPEGAVLGNQGTGQMLVLLNTQVSDLSIENFVFHAAQVWEDRLHQQLGFAEIPATQVWPRDDIATAGTLTWPTSAGNGAPPSGVTGSTFTIDWLYGSHQVLDFNPATDRLDFGWFKADNFSLEDSEAGAIIRITGNDQSYTLAGVGLADLGLHQIMTLDVGARSTWSAALAEASGVPANPPHPGHDHPEDHDHPGDHDDHGDHDNHHPHDPGHHDDPAPPQDPSTPTHPAPEPPLPPGDPTPALPPDWLHYEVRDNWGSGFVADVTLNAGAQGLEQWVLHLEAGFQIVNLWNAEILAHEAGHYVIGAAAWNSTLAAGDSLTWGFQATPGAQGTAVLNWALDADGLALTPLPPAPAEPPPADATELLLNFDVSANWGSGFNGNVTLTNTSAAHQSGWEIWLTLPNAIESLWNAELVGRDGDTYHLRQASWNGELAPDQSTSFGFTASGAFNPEALEFGWLG